MVSDITQNDIWTKSLEEALTYWFYHASRLTESKRDYCRLSGVEQLRKILELCTIFDIDIPRLSKIEENNLHGRFNNGMRRNYIYRVNRANEWLESNKGIEINGKNVGTILGYDNYDYDNDEE